MDEKDKGAIVGADSITVLPRKYKFYISFCVTVRPGNMAYHFGVEIEIIAEPHTVRHPLVRPFYYEKLAAALRKRGEPAVADTLHDKYRKHAEHYDKWWITKDGSLKDPAHPLSKTLSSHQKSPHFLSSSVN
jgi:hypothetical protein